MQALLGLHFSMGNESFCFLEDCMSYSVLALGFSFSLVKRKMGRKKMRVLQVDFKLVSIIGVPNRT